MNTSTPTPTLLPYKHVGGPDSAPTGTLESFNPATNQLIGSVPTITPDQVDSVVAEIY